MRLLIDGMNVIGSRPDRWWNDPDAAMTRLVEWLDDYAGITETEITVVFDTKPPNKLRPKRVQVVFASRKGRNAADHEIEKLVAADPNPDELRVVTSDKRLIEKVTELGAHVLGSGEFRKRLDVALAGSS